jgi:hypothetical protein
MIEVKIDYKEINAEQLHGEIKAALDAKFFGLSTYGEGRQISLWLDDIATPEDQQTAADLVAAHVPEIPIEQEQTLEQQIAVLQSQLDSLSRAVSAASSGVKAE